MADEIETELEAQLEALCCIEELKREKEEQIAARSMNFPNVVMTSRKQHEANKKQLKSDLKKTTAFVKKIRSINTEGLQQCIRDTETLNLTLYISEIVGAIVETAYKATDVPSMIKLCIDLHRRYDEFTEPLLNGLRSALFTAPAEDDQGRRSLNCYS
jgi:regulator of nonsense transcripts 2